jgi:hypothetical protein
MDCMFFVRIPPDVILRGVGMLVTSLLLYALIH